MTVAVLVLLLLPVPWLNHPGSTFAAAWRLDSRLHIDGQPAQVSGTWTMVTHGRPPLVIETVINALRAESGTTFRSLTAGPDHHRPVHSEPFAATIGVNARHLHTEEPPNQTRTNHPPGDLESLPYNPVEAQTIFWFQRVLPERVRDLSVGSSHTLMVALIAYAHTHEPDLARGRHIAGTGTVSHTGRIGRIGGLRHKARAARDAGADLFLYPAAQHDLLDGFPSGTMRLVPVRSIAHAIEELEADD